jgi:hypothetical protein
MSNTNAEDMKAGLAAASAAVVREREDEKARRATMEAANAQPSPLSPNLANAPEWERHTEVIERLDTINASLQQLDASMQQLIRLLSQGK